MKRVEVVFVVAVCVFAVIFSAMSLSHAGKDRTTDAKDEFTGSAGKARDLDIDKVMRLIRSRELSDHEAEFYRDVQILSNGREEPLPDGPSPLPTSGESHDAPPGP